MEKIEKPEKISPKNKKEYRQDEWYGFGVNETIVQFEAYHSQEIAKKDFEIKKLKKKLELMRDEEDRLCPDHRGKHFFDRFGCIACEMEKKDGEE